jgi:hypothetical protein
MSGIENKWSVATTNILKWTYGIVFVLFLLGVASYVYTTLNRPVSATLWALGGALIVFYYGVKWFIADPRADRKLQTMNQACPDYLSMVPPGKLYRPRSPTQSFCVDYVGVSRNGSLKKMDPEKIKTQINNEDYRFSVDPAVDFASNAAKSRFLSRLIARGLSYGAAGEGGNIRQSSLPNAPQGNCS